MNGCLPGTALLSEMLDEVIPRIAAEADAERL
jgi:hypothetical protein